MKILERIHWYDYLRVNISYSKKVCKIPGSFISIEWLKTLKKKWNKTVFLISFVERVIACGINNSMIIIKNNRPYYIKEVFRDLMILVSTMQYTLHYIPKEKRNMNYFQRVKIKIKQNQQRFVHCIRSCNSNADRMVTFKH